jgi:hypothetical protein
MGILSGLFNVLVGSGGQSGAYQSSGGQAPVPSAPQGGGFPQKTKVYCKWCGTDFPDVRTLYINSCNLNPNGSRKHELYEGSEKAQYSCKFCGATFRTIRDMSATKACRAKPDKRHEPAL